jgi:diguanylate cyclase (GGDEF)-like protein/PAS domain S-box-containing protein
MSLIFAIVNDQAATPALGDQMQPQPPHRGVDLLRRILDTAHEAFIMIDADGLILEFNREAERTFGFSREETLGRELAEMIIPERDRAAHRAGLRRYAETGVGRVVGKRIEMSAVHREGHEFPVEMTISEARQSGRDADEIAFHAFLHDISDRKLSERVLVAMQSVTQAMARAKTPQEAMRSLLSTLGGSMGWQAGSYWQLAHDDSLERMASWVGEGVQAAEFDSLGDELRLARDEGLPGRALALGEPVWLQDYSADDHFPRARAARQAGLHAAIAVPVLRKQDIVGVMEFFTSELRVRDRSVSAALATVGEQVGELLGVLEDRQALLTSLARLALTDQLTGLPNRRAWEEALQRELSRADRDDNPVCVAVIDLDEFKRFNDEHGHQAGDALLAEAARAWQGQLRVSDVLARYGGEEFAAVIPACPLHTAIAVVERLRRATPTGLTASAGLASWNRKESAAELFGRADAALYEAKQRGRNRTVATD